MIFHKNVYPGVITGEFGYFQAVLQVGFKAAHRQMLVEAKEWLERNRPYQSSFMIALEAYRIHQSFLRLVLTGQDHSPALSSLEHIFVEVYGFSGKAVIEGERPQSRSIPEAVPGRRLITRNWRVPSKAEILGAVRSG